MEEFESRQEFVNIDPIIDAMAEELKAMIQRVIQNSDTRTQIQVASIISGIAGRVVDTTRAVASIEQLEELINENIKRQPEPPITLDRPRINQILRSKTMSFKEFTAIYALYKRETGFKDAQVIRILGCSKAYFSLLINGKRNINGKSSMIKKLKKHLRNHFREQTE